MVKKLKETNALTPVVGEMFLQNQTEEANGFCVWGTMIGFALMMALDVGLA